MRALMIVGAASVATAALVAGCGPDSSHGGSGCKDQIEPGDLVISEVFADFKGAAGAAGTDDGKEWFEIYNASSRPIDLEGLTLVHARPDGSKSKSHNMTTQTIASEQYLTLGNATQANVPPYVDYGYGAGLGDLFNTDGGKLQLLCGDIVIDEAKYEMIKEGHSRELSASQPPDYTVNDDLTHWCQGDVTEFTPGNFGTPGTENDCQPVVVGQCNDIGTLRDVVPPLPGQLVITEVMPQPTGDDAKQEWFEAKATADFDLNGVGLDRAGGPVMAPNVITSADCIHVASGAYLVFAKNIDMAMNGGLPPASIVGTFKFDLVNGSASAPGDVQIVVGDEIIDAISWTKSTASKSLQLDPDFEDPIANDEPSNFCDGSVAYGDGGAGTPGTENTQCVLLPAAGMCSDGGANRAIVKPAAGQLVITEYLANPAGTGTDTTQEWIEIQNTGATAFDLNDLSLKGNATTTNKIQSSDCKSVGAGGYALFAHNTDPLVNGMLPEVDATFSFALAATNGSIHVLDDATELDGITWATGTQGSIDGASKQLDPDFTTATGNDTPANFCNGTTPYGDLTNKGTPKAANEQCP